MTLAPDGESATWFSIEALDIPIAFGEGDVPLLVGSLHSVLATLPGLDIEWEDQWVIGTLIGIDIKYTFRDGPATPKRWARLLFDEGRCFTVTAQAKSLDDYIYWEPMLFQVITTVVLDSRWYHADESDGAAS